MNPFGELYISPSAGKFEMLCAILKQLLILQLTFQLEVKRSVSPTDSNWY